MQVKALQDGFFNGGRVRAGRVFEVPEGTKGKWFVPVASAKEATPGKPARRAPQTLSQAGAEPAQNFVDAHADGTLA